MRIPRPITLAAIAVACVCVQCGAPVEDMNRFSESSRKANDLDVVSGPVALTGMLIDAGCSDRASMNLRRPPETLLEEAPAEPPNAAQNNPPVSGAVSAKGISVNSATITAERTGVMGSHVPGMFERQGDPTCAITASTTAFAVLTDQGRLIDLGPGGDTLALVALQATRGGRAELNGQGPGVKPRVRVKGEIRGNRLMTNDLTVTP